VELRYICVKIICQRGTGRNLSGELFKNRSVIRLSLFKRIPIFHMCCFLARKFCLADGVVCWQQFQRAVCANSNSQVNTLKSATILRLVSGLPLTIKPKKLILNLLKGATEPVATQVFVKACGLFNISENSTRVGLARLASEDLIETVERGFYRLGPNASVLADELFHWRFMEEKLCNWDESWIAVYLGNLGRRDKTSLRRRERVLKLNGFGELEQGMVVRPNNIIGGVGYVRDRMYKLGLETEAIVFQLAELDQATLCKAKTLWDVKSLNSNYQNSIDSMEAWMKKSKADPEIAARESFLLGDQALHDLAYDPLLPKELVDVALRKKFLKTMIHYDEVGKTIWHNLYQSCKLPS